MIITIRKALGYGYTATPMNARLANAMRLDMIEGGAGGPGDPHCLCAAEVEAELYLQEFYDVEDTLGDYITASNLKYLDQGYAIDIRVPNDDFRSMLGFCDC